MPNISKIGSLQQKISKLRDAAKDANASVLVGFSQRYAIYVHENMNAHHPVGQAKFLEQPARELASELAGIIKKVYQQTGSIRKGLVVAGLRLQREAQLLTPVDTSALKASAWTALENEAAAAEAAAFSQSEIIRTAGKAVTP